MADHGRTEYATATGNDYAEHESTYHNVMKLTKVGTILVLAWVVGLAIFGTVGSTFWLGVALVLSIVAGVIGAARDSAVPGMIVLVLLLLVWALLV
ncbi:aa3-type cytochrome c oxidase subunit IV [Terrihabitans sp. B22-R8]|uniref:aa3-type cytochrome c oxidase subunit IV n=1 Tax=Terrihabitans sp. B22-R8 TaxID=3425128 RepID=UPI00403C9235